MPDPRWKLRIASRIAVTTHVKFFVNAEDVGLSGAQIAGRIAERMGAPNSKLAGPVGGAPVQQGLNAHLVLRTGHHVLEFHAA